MNVRSLFRSGSRSLFVLALVARVAALLLPAALLLTAARRRLDESHRTPGLGPAFRLLACSPTSRARHNARQPMGPAVVTLYIIALGWLWLGTPYGDDWFLVLAKAPLLVVPLLCFS